MLRCGCGVRVHHGLALIPCVVECCSVVCTQTSVNRESDDLDAEAASLTAEHKAIDEDVAAIKQLQSEIADAKRKIAEDEAALNSEEIDDEKAAKLVERLAKLEEREEREKKEQEEQQRAEAAAQAEAEAEARRAAQAQKQREAKAKQRAAEEKARREAAEAEAAAKKRSTEAALAKSTTKRTKQVSHTEAQAQLSAQAALTIRLSWSHRRCACPVSSLFRVARRPRRLRPPPPDPPLVPRCVCRLVTPSCTTPMRLRPPVLPLVALPVWATQSICRLQARIAASTRDWRATADSVTTSAGST